MVQDKLPCLLDVQLFDLLRGHVQFAHEHCEDPRLVLDLLLCVHGRGLSNGLTGGERLPKRGRVNLGTDQQGASIGLRREDQPQQPRHLLGTIGLRIEVQTLEVPLGVGEDQLLELKAACSNVSPPATRFSSDWRSTNSPSDTLESVWKSK